MKIIRQAFNIIKESIKGLRRNMTMALASTVSVAAMLTLFGFVFLLILNINGAVYHLGGELDKVVVYLDDGLPANDVNSLISEIGSDERVKKIQYTSKDQALDSFKEGLGEKAYILDSLPENTLPASLVVTLKDLSYASEMASEIKEHEGIERVDYHYELVQKMMVFEKGIKYIGYAIVLILLLVSVLIIHNTIKIAVTNREREINIMKYVGATNSYIKGPFLIEGVIFGVVGALIAFLIVYYGYEFLYGEVNVKIQNLFGMSISTPDKIRSNLSVIFICIGAGIGYLGSLVSTERFLDV
ncbi:cell division transport system permease protein [Anaerosphaera aminiphila DSM 21120]|uniref:Cell division protein FtsX n=1 Tax=Anaerosphaera aminiphila DSM 21120 TaxID=1120995 RepID=A0A1M5R4R4_9FIRM|nr:permease-like cell division protein FtsX [Anaerosphaera aminiphila]SHH21384.1 cell division transport system permease protein [Anaerosphaera aminiphila DSM 21120]